MEKIYLAGGQQVWRDSVRVEAYGDVDELNSTIGVVRVFNAELLGIHPSADRLEEGLRWMQNKLFDDGLQSVRRRRGCGAPLRCHTRRSCRSRCHRTSRDQEHNRGSTLSWQAGFTEAIREHVARRRRWSEYAAVTRCWGEAWPIQMGSSPAGLPKGLAC
jgi:cob(I)alamin adenosyltransferase